MAGCPGALTPSGSISSFLPVAMAKISEASFPRASSIRSPSPSQGRATEEEEEVWEEISLSSLSRDAPDPLSRTPNSLSLHNILTSRGGGAAAAANPEAAGKAVSVDPRKKRMMKNRESAARSRARKQAYTDELEKEVEHLSKENRRLELKYEKLLKQTLAAGIPPAKKRKKIQRTVSAPF